MHRDRYCTYSNPTLKELFLPGLSSHRSGPPARLTTGHQTPCQKRKNTIVRSTVKYHACKKQQWRAPRHTNETPKTNKPGRGSPALPLHAMRALRVYSTAYSSTRSSPFSLALRGADRRRLPRGPCWASFWPSGIPARDVDQCSGNTSPLVRYLELTVRAGGSCRAFEGYVRKLG